MAPENNKVSNNPRRILLIQDIMTLTSNAPEDNIDTTLTALTTLTLLHSRLTRLEHNILGHVHNPNRSEQVAALSQPLNTVPARVSDLEARLNRLRRSDGVPGSMVRTIENLHREHPEIFRPTSASVIAGSDSATGTGNSIDGTTAVAPRPSAYTLAQQASEILAHQSVYTSTSAHLQTLQTLQVPPAGHSAILIEQEPRILALRERQDKLEQEIEALRSRSARILEWWVRTGVVGLGEVVEDWEDRIIDCNRVTTRLERRMHDERASLNLR